MGAACCSPYRGRGRGRRRGGCGGAAGRERATTRRGGGDDNRGRECDDEAAALELVAGSATMRRRRGRRSWPGARRREARGGGGELGRRRRSEAQQPGGVPCVFSSRVNGGEEGRKTAKYSTDVPVVGNNRDLSLISPGCFLQPGPLRLPVGHFGQAPNGPFSPGFWAKPGLMSPFGARRQIFLTQVCSRLFFLSYLCMNFKLF